MPDTPHDSSSFRHPPRALKALTVMCLAAGLLVRCLATQGELWLDELWSLLHVAGAKTPIELVTTIKHDNNHLLNSFWMWLVGQHAAPFVYRLPSLAFSIALLLLIWRSSCSGRDGRIQAIWCILVAVSYPLTLYGSEARGYALALLMSLMGYVSLSRLIAAPYNSRAILTFSVASSIGLVAHAIYILFLAPAIAWLGYMFLTSNLRSNSRRVIYWGLIPPVVIACALLFLFYRGMEIGGGPLLPYLEVAASTISVACGGEALSASSPVVTGWSLFLCVVVVAIGLIELGAWARSKDPLAILVGLILVTPFIAVTVFQPHFILSRYFIIQILFSYLLLSRFLVRLTDQGRIGSLVSWIILLSFVMWSVRHSIQLWSFGRSHFVEIFSTIVEESAPETATVGGDQDYQNSLRLRYAEARIGKPLSISYLTEYRSGQKAPRFVIRESLDAYEEFPVSWTSPRGTTYKLKTMYRAPPLNGANVYVYESAP